MSNWLETHKYELERYYPQQRLSGFTAIYKELTKRKNVTIVETGGYRMPNNVSGDGNSTLFFISIVHEIGGHVYTVDLDPICADNITKENGSELVTAHTGDSLEFLPNFINNFNGKVDLLYLDSFDVDFQNDTPAAEHHLKELKLAEPLFHSGMLVAVDDNLESGAGKGRLVAEYAKEQGWQVLEDSYIKVWKIN